jgi:hypothetical protein
MQLSVSEQRAIELLKKKDKLYLSDLSDVQRQELANAIDSLHNSKGLSILGIAECVGKSQSFMWRICHCLGIPTRTIEQANRLSGPTRSKHLRASFSGSENDRVYMKGFSMGDLNAAKASEISLFVSTTTTHPSFSTLFQNLFSKYGQVYTYPIRDDLGRFKWKVAVRLDRTFDFLLPSDPSETIALLTNPLFRASWLAGLIDSDGMVEVLHSGKYARFRIAISSSDRKMLRKIVDMMEDDGYRFDGPYRTVEKGYTTKTLGITYRNDHWIIALQRNEEVKRLLAILPLRHLEKVAVKSLILQLGGAVRWDAIEPKVMAIRKSIALQVTAYAEKAESVYNSRPRKIKKVRKATFLPSPILHRRRTN